MKYYLKKVCTSIYPAFKFYNFFKSAFLKYPESDQLFSSLPSDIMKSYNKTRVFGAKKLFCYSPFINLFFNTSGHAIACCRSHQNILGIYPEQSIKDIWTGHKIEKLRQFMLHNDLSMGCAYCKFQLETKRYRSLPSALAEEFANSTSYAYPRIIEFELSNVCNLECVMCSGRVSSAIRKNREHDNPLAMPYDDNFVEQLKEFIPHLKQAYFFGGEPFLIPIYYKIWEEIIKLNPKIELYAVTNGTILNDRIKNILLRTKFNIIISLDSLNKERAAKIRCGANLDEVLSNINEFFKLTKRRVSISHTPMTINWFETPDIIEYCNKIDATINLSYVEGPSEFALWSLLPEQLEEIYTHYNNVKWKNNIKKFRAKNNIRVFEEWKNQILYFKEKNQQILATFSNLSQQWQEVSEKVLSLILGFKGKNPDYDSRVQAYYEYFLGLLKKTSPSPWSLKCLKEITAQISNEAILLNPDFERHLNNPMLIKDYFDSYTQSDFFKDYY
ncbi:MAG: twitch domain-containing radical SAM protein [Bacteroidales bacterium]|nr:twitch domain-containing radical SAM protein [Bacteroidales bacterium]